MKKLFLLLVVILSLSKDLRAQFYIEGTDTTSTNPISYLQITGSGLTSSLFTNQSGQRWWKLQLSGGSGGGTSTVIVASNCVALVSLGGNTNAIAVDTNCLYAEGFAMEGDLTTLSNYLAGIFTGSGVTNGLATITFVNNLSNYLAGAINTVTNGLETMAAINTLSNFFANSGFVTVTITNGLETIAAANNLTNGLETISATTTLSNFFANSGFVTLTVTNGLASLSLLSSTSNTIMNEAVAADNLATTADNVANTASNLAATADSTAITASNLAATANGAAQTALQPASTNGMVSEIISGGQSGAGSVSSNNGVYTITFPAGSSIGGTNAVSTVQGVLTGNVVLATQVGSFTTSQSGGTGTITLNMAKPLVQLTVFQGGTNFNLSGGTIFLTNANTQGGTFSLNSSGTLVIGGSISNLTAAVNPGGLSYDHTATDSGSGSGTLSLQSSGGDLYLKTTTNLTGQAFCVSLDSGASIVFKNDQGGNVPRHEFKMGMVNGLEVTWGAYDSQGSEGFTFDSDPPHVCVMLSLGQPYANTGYATQAGAANFIVDELSTVDVDEHKWYPGNNTNFPAIWVKAGGYQATSATGTVMNSDWINIGACSSTNGTLKAGFIGVASNEDFLAIWQSRGMSTNQGTLTGVQQYSTNATDSLQFGTNRFGGFLFGRNDTFGTNNQMVISVLLRDETNGLQVITVSTNNGGSLYMGTTNNLEARLIGPAPAPAVTFQDTNIVCNVGADGTEWLYSSQLANISGAIITMPEGTDGNGTGNQLVQILLTASNSVEVVIRGWNGRNGDVENVGSPLVLTNYVHFYE
jgi:hypothetical protein